MLCCPRCFSLLVLGKSNLWLRCTGIGNRVWSGLSRNQWELTIPRLRAEAIHHGQAMVVLTLALALSEHCSSGELCENVGQAASPGFPAETFPPSLFTEQFKLQSTDCFHREKGRLLWRGFPEMISLKALLLRVQELPGLDLPEPRTGLALPAPQGQVSGHGDSSW